MIHTEKVAKLIENTLGVDMHDMQTKYRHRKLIIARVIFTHLLRMLYNYGYSEIGRTLQHNHSTIIYYAKMHRDLTITKDRHYMNAYSKVTEMMQLEAALSHKKEKSAQILEWLREHHDHPDFNIILSDRDKYRQEIDEIELKIKNLTIN